MAVSACVCALALVVTGCGSAASTSGAGAAGSATQAPATSRPTGGSRGFAWLRPAPAPAGWSSERVPNGATLAYPSGWHVVEGDRGSATAVLPEAGGHDLGYLNLTPRQPPETLSDWTAFRPHHNLEEGERQVVTEAAAGSLRFRTGRGACVQDSYTTSTGRRYVEIACLVEGAHASSVIVGAALAGSWARERATIERAIDALTT